ncbi:MAG TPA: exodeoxyribonuclease VII large subunit [Desulfohalobiaceae bacterium]|nr:exodeoxyribonuclease VII large subunit [Desulfohalobiaceae bacterium]
MNQSYLYNVSQLTQAIKEGLEASFPFIWVKGQVGSISRPDSGHIYLTLKDGQAILQVVWFKSFHKAFTGLPPEKLTEGMEIICAGRISVYPPRGTYQFLAELIQDQGIGQLYLEYEALKNKLSQKGYFDHEHKQTIPSDPSRILVLTSPSGAAMHDFLCLSADRGYRSRIRIYPVQVQGEGAEKSIIQGLNLANKNQWAEVIVIIRGGGSLEDLWTFNKEEVATAVYNSSIPVVTGIGHETDLSITDLTADLRAVTPSHAAQLIWTERSHLVQRLDELNLNLKQAWDFLFWNKWKTIKQSAKALSWLSPDNQLERIKERQDTLLHQLLTWENNLLRQSEERLKSLSNELKKCLSRKRFDSFDNHLHYLTTRLQAGIRYCLDHKEHKFSITNKALKDSDPKLPLLKGYSLVKIRSTQEILHSSSQVKPDDYLDIQTYKDNLLARVIKDDN